MAVGYFLVLDNQPPGVEPPLSGKALALAEFQLKELWDEAGLPKGGGIGVFAAKRMNDHIHKILAENLTQLQDTFRREMELPDNETRWFRPELGIQVIDILIAQIRKKPDAIPEADAIIADLNNYRIVLGMAQKEGAMWHLSPVDPDEDKLDAGMAYRSGEYEKAIRLYTRALGYTHPEAFYDRAFMLTERGDCWSYLGDQERAIADYDAALGAQPDYKYAFLNRGSAWAARGDHERALADLDAAIRVEPEYWDAYANRGRTHFLRGDFKKAAADLARALKEDPDAYKAIWLYLARARDGVRNPLSELAAVAKALESEDWPFPLLALFQGKATPESVIAAAERGDADTLEQQRCDARFYVGQWYLLRKDTERARALLRQVTFSEATLYEHFAALADLRRPG